MGTKTYGNDWLRKHGITDELMTTIWKLREWEALSLDRIAVVVDKSVYVIRTVLSMCDEA